MILESILPARATSSGSHISPEDIAHLDARLGSTNINISRYLAVISLALAPLLVMIDVHRWQTGRFEETPLYWLLAVLHASLVLSAAPGLVLWMPKKVGQSLLVASGRIHLIVLTSSLAAMGILGIAERGGLVLLAIALLCANLVYQIKLRQRLLFNLLVSLIGALTLFVFAEGGTIRTLIVTAEMLGLVLVCAVAGELRFRDFTALILAERAMASMAYADSLTGLANRRSLQEHICRHLASAARGRPFTVVLVDVDHFKAVNDTHGHDVGDEVLKVVAEVMLAGARQPDIVGRWGGEEFLVICPDTAEEGGRLLAERLASHLRVREIGKAGRRTASFGVAQASHEETMESLLVRADEALYAAKKGGRDRVCVAARA